MKRAALFVAFWLVLPIAHAWTVGGFYSAPIFAQGQRVAPPAAPPPTLSSPTGIGTGSTTASGTVTTDTAAGTLYCYISINATETASTVKASGQTQSITSTGSKSCSFSSLTASTTYYTHWVHNAAGNDSSVANSASFSTSAGGSSDITLALSTSRTSCVAPCYVYFDASGTTSTSTTKPQRDIDYTWDFGDATGSGSGTCGSTISAGTALWACGARPGVLSKNAAKGNQAAHVFESATGSPFTVTLTAHNATGDSQTTVSIAVTAADTQWATTSTVCLSTDTDFTGCPSGATHVGSIGTGNAGASFNSNFGTGKRVLFHAGQTFNIGTALNIAAAGPWMVGAFGSGAKPILSNTGSNSPMINIGSSDFTAGANDGRIVDLFLDNLAAGPHIGGNGNADNILLLRNDFYNGNANTIALSPSLPEYWNGNGKPGQTMWDLWGMVDNRFYGYTTDTSGMNACYCAASRQAFMGNYIDKNQKGEHGWRSQFANRAVVTYNRIVNIGFYSGVGRHNIAVRGQPWAGTSITPAGTYSEKVYIADNWLETNPGPTGMIQLGSENNSSDERVRDVVVERNWIDATTGGSMPILIGAPRITVRNNTVRISGYAPVYLEQRGISGTTPLPDDVDVYYNSAYSSQGGQANFVQSGISSGSFVVKNNLIYAPSSTSTAITSGGGSFTTSNNTTTASTSPSLTTTPPTQPSHFKPTVATTPSGTSVPVWYDFFGVTIPGTPDIGAIVH